MDILIHECIEIENIDTAILSRMNYLHEYLENGWTIKYTNFSYKLKKEDLKIIFSNQYRFKKQSHVITNYDNKFKYIFVFLFNVLNNGWTIKKNNSDYIIYKKHQGQKELFSKHYLASFMEEHFKLNKLNK
tara:strand:- start:307 stop:699 length:393 start_codon:yes stop_codon:yes gene_type:complete